MPGARPEDCAEHAVMIGRIRGIGLSRRDFLAASAVAVAATVAPAAVSEKPPMPEDYAKLLSRLRTPHKYPELVLPPSFKLGEYDSLAVDCPFVFRHKRRYYMTHIGFDGTGYRTGIAWSKDLVKWEKEGLILDRGPAGSPTEFNAALSWIVRDNDLFGEGTLKKFNGKFVGTYHAYPRPGYETGPAAIGIAYSKDFHTWNLKEPSLRASDEGAGDWERGGLYKSCIVEHEGTFYMFYNAKTADSPWAEQTGLATSTDLKNWTRHPDNPLVRNGQKGSFDDTFCSDPCVLRAGDIWVMFFYTLSSADGKARDSVAFSRDLVHWEKSGEILIEPGPEGSVDSRYAHKPAVFFNDGVFYHYYCAVSPAAEKRRGNVEVSEIRGIGLAVS